MTILGSISTAFMTVPGSITVSAVTNTRAVVDEVDVTEITVVIVSSVTELVVSGITGAWSARLFVGVTVGADDERVVILVVETVVTAGT